MYPEWATKFRTKGTILRKKNSTSFYLFYAHSKRVKSKKYPVLVQDELIGVIDEKGLTHNTRKIIDINFIEIKSISELRLYKLLSNDAKEVLRDIYTLKIKNKWYFSKLSDAQKKVLSENGIDYIGGILENEND